MGQRVLRILDQKGIKVRIKLKSKVKRKIDEGEISETSTQYRVYSWLQKKRELLE
jgi:ABC-type lipoprotein release transport system permease subunit